MKLRDWIKDMKTQGAELAKQHADWEAHCAAYRAEYGEDSLDALGFPQNYPYDQLPDGDYLIPPAPSG